MSPVAYDPLYDPLTSQHPGRGKDYAPSYWAATAGTPPITDGPVTQDIDTEVAIIGSGSTGVSTALYLAQEHGIQATILEANQTAWGCSSRSGGQGQNASGRLSRSQWIERWGLDTAKQLDREIYTGFENFKELVSEIDCDAIDGGHLYVAHRPEKMVYLQNEAKVRKEVFGYAPLLLSAQEVREQYCDDRDAAGALLEREGVGVHPLKLTFGLLKKAQKLGVKIHTASPALGWETINGVHHIQTPGGVVKAKRIAICTGGYGMQGLPPIKNKILPILSNSLATRPLTEQEITACNFRSKTFLTDTRTLRFYYRLLKDNRLQIGSRSAIRGTDANAPEHLKLLTDGIARKFPPLAGIEIDYSWWGWVDVSHDMMPRITQPDPKKLVWYALGYGGNGVSFSTWAGKRLAELVAGKNTDAAVFKLPIYQSPLEFPNIMGGFQSEALAPFRRLGQSVLYKWYWFKDEK
jgi:glycine/D-amino acid oxidase-like deaminating enzyme